MASKTCVNGTNYLVVEGKTLLSGTAYTIKDGKTLVGGTAYTIPLSGHVIELTFNANGGTGGMTKLYYRYAENAFFSDSACTQQVTTVTKPTRTGYDFAHYYGDGSCGGTNGERYVAYESTIFASDLCTDIYKSATLYAKWTPKTYTMSFDSNGGSACSAKTVTYEAAIGTLPTPTRSGYHFVGWFTGTASRDSSIAYKDRPWIYYSDAYGDLYNAFGYNDLSLASHYWDAGQYEGRRRSQYLAADIYRTAGDITLYAGWTPVYNVSQTTENWSDWSFIKDLAWEDYEGYRSMSINGGGDIAATTRTDTAVYGQRLYVMAKNKYSERWSNIIVNNVDQGEYHTAEYSMPISAPTAVVWVFDTRNWIFDNPQAFWDCYIWY